VVQDPEFKNAMKAWSACMARNGYTSSDPDTFFHQQLVAPFRQRPDPGLQPDRCAEQGAPFELPVK
jgi:hypothetical protein